ncbi:MAG: DUF6048 family protein [Ekhidna sp.]|uniref:DUF6048 family protein n=1 Tax=Ekhidna sp. TaxID=2608089 RepID=UPI0032EF59C0
MWKCTFSILSLVFCLGLSGQEQPSEKKEKLSFRPYEVKIGMNAIRTGRTFFNSGLTTHEVEVALALHRYNVVLDYGIEEHQRGETFDYENKGSYFRTGIDRNFTKDQQSGNVLSLGLRYARASFEDQLIYTEDYDFGEETFNLSNPDLSARWFEVAFGLRGKLVSNLYMGFTMRWQFARKIDGEGELKTYEIPGFGKTKRQNSTAFDYYLMWRVPFKN